MGEGRILKVQCVTIRNDRFWKMLYWVTWWLNKHHRICLKSKDFNIIKWCDLSASSYMAHPWPLCHDTVHRCLWETLGDSTLYPSRLMHCLYFQRCMNKRSDTLQRQVMKQKPLQWPCTAEGIFWACHYILSLHRASDGCYCSGKAKEEV